MVSVSARDWAVAALVTVCPLCFLASLEGLDPSRVGVGSDGAAHH